MFLSSFHGRGNRFREVKGLVQRHTAAKQWSWGLNGQQSPASLPLLCTGHSPEREEKATWLKSHSWWHGPRVPLTMLSL